MRRKLKKTISGGRIFLGCHCCDRGLWLRSRVRAVNRNFKKSFSFDCRAEGTNGSWTWRSHSSETRGGKNPGMNMKESNICSSWWNNQLDHFILHVLSCKR